MSPHPTTTQCQQPLPANRSYPANRLDPHQRQQLAIEALAGSVPIRHLAQRHDVSRTFVYQQAHRAQQALDDAFATEADEQQVLFTLPITRSLLRQIVLGLVLLGHSSFRGVVEFFTDVLDWPLSLGTVHNIVHAAVPTARVINDRQDLAAVRIGAHDEIFQTQRPVLVGACADSTYCYLLSQEEHRDACTWGLRLLELADRGFAPEATVADFGAGLRAGHKEALPGIACQGDVFHAVYECGKVESQLESLAWQAMSVTVALQRQQATPGKRRDRHKQSLVVRLRNARQKQAQAIALYDDVAVLLRWLREDILSVAGPQAATRRVLFDFVVDQLQQREAQGPPAVAKMRKALANQREQLLAFAVSLDEKLTALAASGEVPVEVVYALWQVQALPMTQPQRWQREAVLRQRLGVRYERMRRVLSGLAGSVVRASSVVENLNSRLRSYFFLRRELGEGYLSLLQFVLNHRRFLRSEHQQRVGKSPAELLTGQSHPHWLEMLGYQRHKQN